MLRKIRLTLAVLFFTAVTLLFLDFTGILHTWLGWTAKIQFLIALFTFLIIGVLAWRNGRTYCNTVCPVGTVLGVLARFSWLKPAIDTDKCVNCKLCARNCKAACIDIANHRIDYSRCVACMDCIGMCHKGAISYKHPMKKAVQSNANGAKISTEQINDARRSFLTATALVATTAALKAQEKKVDGGLAVIEDKKIPDRKTRLSLREH